ncbi:MAG: hypothetical protein JSV35_07885 [Candidatus Bathyarchaeota archaeon]|nr:MAG: hypothetical protein JSV35_07885 [Candidatus Bathyarchaeota archaeon]
MTEREIEFFKLIDENKLNEALELLETFTEAEMQKLIQEMVMVEQIVKSKISFLKQKIAES